VTGAYVSIIVHEGMYDVKANDLADMQKLSIDALFDIVELKKVNQWSKFKDFEIWAHEQKLSMK
jgi:hypothetical protein